MVGSARGTTAGRRIARLREACAREGMDAFYVRGTSNIAWLSGFDGVFDDEAAHALAVTPERAVLHTDSRYSLACERAAAGTPIEVDASRRVHAQVAAEVVGGGVSGEDELSAARTPAVGIEYDVTLAEYRRLQAAFGDGGAAGPARAELRETSGFVLGLRAVKDAEEIERMKAAQRITDAAFAHIVSFMRPGMTERAVQIELEDFMRRHGADDLAFSSIVACGANGASPQAIPGNAVLEAGQCVVMDFGAKARGYCSDMTRTVFLGVPEGTMLRAWETLRAANEAVEAALRPGVTGADMHRLAENVLAEGGFGGRMGHGLGHGVGMDIHEEPTLSPRNDRPLIAGNVVTVEPGIYLPGEFGMRLEDFGAVTEDGFDIFTKSTHEMVII